MIGYKNWSKLLTKAAEEPTWKTGTLLSDWKTIARPAIEVLIQEDADDGDELLMEKRFRLALNDAGIANAPRKQLFYNLGNFKASGVVDILRCPNDCIIREDLQEIADIIFKGDERALTPIQTSLLAWGFRNGWSADPVRRGYQWQQFCGIVFNVVPGSLVVPIDALLPCDLHGANGRAG